MSDERTKPDNHRAQGSPNGQEDAGAGRAEQHEEEVDEDLHSYIQDLEEKVASSRTAKEVIKTLKEVLTSPNAPKIAEAIATPIAKAKEAEAHARGQAAKSYATASNIGNAVFVLSLILCLTFLGWVIHTLKGDKDLLLPVLSAVISLIAGAGGGYVFGRQSVPKK
jgi:hypothetical protein